MKAKGGIIMDNDFTVTVALVTAILRDGRYSSDSKSVAGSALSQTKTGKKSK